MMKTMTREEVAQLAIRKYAGTICLVASAQDLERAVYAIRDEQVVGLDTETKPTFRKGQFYLPCLVQIATASAVYLFQLKRMEFSDVLIEVLENPALIKAGIGLADDFSSLKRVFPFEPQNIVDLSLVAQQQGLKQSGVRNLAAQLLGFRVTKGSSTSNWANPRLTPKQIVYAATDAWVCRELFLRFQQLGFLV
jgi:ribonuclease D